MGCRSLLEASRLLWTLIFPTSKVTVVWTQNLLLSRRGHSSAISPCLLFRVNPYPLSGAARCRNVPTWPPTPSHWTQRQRVHGQAAASVDDPASSPSSLMSGDPLRTPPPFPAAFSGRVGLTGLRTAETSSRAPRFIFRIPRAQEGQALHSHKSKKAKKFHLRLAWNDGLMAPGAPPSVERTPMFRLWQLINYSCRIEFFLSSSRSRDHTCTPVVHTHLHMSVHVRSWDSGRGRTCLVPVASFGGPNRLHILALASQLADH